MHLLKKKGARNQYKNVLFLDTETSSLDDGKTQSHTVRLCVFCFVRLSDDYEVLEESWYFTKRRDTVLEFIEKKLLRNRTLTIVASNVCFDLAALGFFRYFSQRGYELKFFVEKGLTFILSLKKGNKYLRAISIQNLLPFGIKDLGSLIGERKLEIDLTTEDNELLTIYCFRDCEILVDSFLYFCKFVRATWLEDVTLTLASQSQRIFLNRYMKYPILVHDDDAVRKLERNSYRGGRTEAFRIGELNEDRYVIVDVNSMYPYVMKKYEVPTKLLGSLEDVSVGLLQDLLREFCVIAEVVVETDENVYPYMEGGKCLFPIGYFTTTLCTASLKYAISHCHIVNINKLSYYKKAVIFDVFVDDLWNLRKDFLSRGMNVESRFLKLILNSVYGKFAEQHDVEIVNEYTESDDFNLQYAYDYTNDCDIIDFQMFHRHIIRRGKEDSDSSFVAVASHITDYARMELWGIMQKVGLDRVIYVDTDSLILTEGDCHEYLRDSLGSELGQLKIEKTSGHLEIFGVKDYIFGDTVKIKGIRKEVQEVGQTEFHQIHSVGLLKMMEKGKYDAAILRHVTKTLNRTYNKGLVNPDGTVDPFLIVPKLDLPF